MTSSKVLPIEPISFSQIMELISNYDPRQMRMDNLFQDILPFYDKWVNNATKFLDIVLEDLATNLKRKVTLFPKYIV